MKTDAALKTSSNRCSRTSNNSQLKKTAKTEAFGDKENTDKRVQASTSECLKTIVTDPCDKMPRLDVEQSNDKSERAGLVGVHSDKKYVNKNPSTDKPVIITAEDLTKPVATEQYWRTLCDKQREALAKSLEENKVLDAKVQLLTQENETLKQALQDATDVINELNDIIRESDFESSLAVSEEAVDPDIQPIDQEKASSSKDLEAFDNNSTVVYDSDDSD